MIKEGMYPMNKLNKLREDLVKAEITLANARKRKNFLVEKIRKEEQRELQTMMDNMGLSLEDMRDLIGGSSAITNPNNNGGATA